MLREQCLVLAFLATASLAFGQSPAGDRYFAATSHDFGTVPRGAQLLHRFTWTNHDSTRREIVELRTSCGCVSAAALPRVLEPGQSGVIETHVDARKFVGQKNVTIHVAIGPDKPHLATLTLSAHSRPDVVFNPGQVHFGVVPEGASPRQDLEIEYAGAADWRITEVVNESPHLAATLAETYRKPGQVGYRLEVVLHADAPGGDFKEVVHLKTNDPNYPSIPVLVEATVRPILTLAPNPVTFGTVRVKQSVQRRVTIRGERPFRILAIEGQGQGLTATAPTAGAKVQVVTLHWQPNEAAELNVQLVVRTDVEKSPSLRLRVEGDATD